MVVFERISKGVRTAATIFLLVGAVVCASAVSARAGQYHVYSCRTPSGEVAPTDGWTGHLASGGAYDDYVEDTCQSGGALIAALGDLTTHLNDADEASWVFSAPEVDHLVSGSVWRAGYTHASGDEVTSYAFWLSAAVGESIFDECVYTDGCPTLGTVQQPMSATNQVVVPTTARQIYVTALCTFGSDGRECGDGFGDSNGYAAAVYLYAADLVLEQSANPSGGDVSGELASAATVSGTSDVAFSASDPGAGVYEAVFSVDGQVMQSTVLDENGGRCKNVGETSDGLPAFLYVQPCEASVSADVGFDTARLSNGAHHLVVSVTDAAGNSAPVLDREITVENPSPSGTPSLPGTPGSPNGTNASAQASLSVAWKATRKQSLTVAYGHAETIDGRLTALGGTAISGAQVEVLATPDDAGAQAVAMRSVPTAENGTFSLRLPAGTSSRTLRFVYRAQLGDVVPASTRTLTLGVRAGITLTISPRTSSVGRSIHFHGHLRGGPVPAEGKQLVLEARSPGGPWIEFDVVRTDARGRYHASYRFKFAGPANYQFRVRSEPESDYPYAAGASAVIGVHERG
jgi:hypothetical protein